MKVEDRFFVGKSRDGWTPVTAGLPMTWDGNAPERVVINAFGGANSGRTEAERYARLLNEAVRKFYEGQDAEVR